jgi:O-antigen/teichoic acid export membrane protein
MRSRPALLLELILNRFVLAVIFLVLTLGNMADGSYWLAAFSAALTLLFAIFVWKDWIDHTEETKDCL